MRTVGFAALSGAALLGMAGHAAADTFVLSNTTHPGCDLIVAQGDCANLAGNGFGGPIPGGGYQIVGPDLTTASISAPNVTRLTAIADSDKILTFDWDYVSFDDLTSFFDPAGYFGVGADIQLTTTVPHFEHLTGEVAFSVAAGDSYGFYVASGDSTSGPGMITFNLVSSVPLGAIVPEPGTWALMILGFGMAGAVRRRRALA